jgi:hypothetical protein
MARIIPTALAMALAAGCTTSVIPPEPTAGEPITPALFREAQAHAARLAGIETYDAHSVHIATVPIARLREVAGDHSAHACVFAGSLRVLYCRNDRPWQSDRDHHFGILIHEGMHSLQPDAMPRGCREKQAHAVQVA